MLKLINKIILCLIVLFISSNGYCLNLKDYFCADNCGYLYKETDSNAPTICYYVTIIQKIKNGNETIIREYEREQPPDPPEIIFGEVEDYNWDEEGLKLYRYIEYDDEEGLTDNSYNPPELIIPLNMDVGDEIDTGIQTVKLLSANETVSVPGGTFSDCIKIQTMNDEENGITWLAKGIGAIKSEGSSDGEQELIEFTAARIGNKIIGDTAHLGCGNDISFAFAIPTINGTSLILDGIFIRGYEDTFWAKFDFNLNTLSFDIDLNNVGIGSHPLDIDTPSVENLNLNVMLPYIFPCEEGAMNPAFLFVGAEYGGHVYYLEMLFNQEKLSFDVLKIWDEDGNLIM